MCSPCLFQFPSSSLNHVVVANRYRLWTLQDSLAGHIFRSSHFSAAPNWALLSLKFLSEKQLLDWPIWMSQSPRGTYKHYLEEALSRPVCFDLKEGLALHLPWDVLLSQRAVIQLRRGYISLGHLNGKKSKAQVQQCIFCGRRYSHVKLHVLCACTCFKDFRQPCATHFPSGLDMSILNIPPSHPGYRPMALFAQEVVRQAQYFWKE